VSCQPTIPHVLPNVEVHSDVVGTFPHLTSIMNSTIQPIDPWTVPLHKPPPGSRSDFNERSNLLDLTIAMVSIMVFLTITIMALRFWANWGRDTWKMDDCAPRLRAYIDVTDIFVGCAVGTSIITIVIGGMLIPCTRAFGKPDHNIPAGLLLYGSWFQRVKPPPRLTTRPHAYCQVLDDRSSCLHTQSRHLSRKVLRPRTVLPHLWQL